MFKDKDEDRWDLDSAWSDETQNFETLFSDDVDSKNTYSHQLDSLLDEPMSDSHAALKWYEDEDDAWMFEETPASSHAASHHDSDDDDDMSWLYDDDDDLEPDCAPASTPVPANPMRSGGKHAAHAPAPVSKKEEKRAEKQAELESMPEFKRKSVSSRKKLVAVIVILIILLAALILGATRFLHYQSAALVQQSNETAQSESSDGETMQVDEASRSESKVSLPNLATLFDLTEDEAIEQIGMGATVSSEADVNEEDTDVKTLVSLQLSEQPSDGKSGTPTVRLGLNEDGKVVMAGYSAATSSLGYGSLSYQDLIQNENIIGRTLGEAGVTPDEDHIELPSDTSEYQTYDSDGATLIRESYTFEGSGTANDGSAHDWSAVLTYDYTAANASGNLADTVRQISVYVYK